MSLRKIYLQELGRIQERINALFERALLQAGYDDGESGSPGAWSPIVDILETSSAYLVCAELPGFRREEIDIRFGDGVLELSGCRSESPGSWRFLRMERHHGSFHRTFRPAAAVAPESLAAELERGILTITLPKAGDEPPPATPENGS